MEVIELIENGDMEQRLLRSLERRELPDYFLYLGDWGAENWLELDRSREFSIASRLTDLLRRHAEDVVEALPQDVDLVSCGVGDGSKERILLEQLCERGQRPRYLAVDISRPMVETALEAVEGLNVEATGVRAFAQDLPALREYWEPPILLALLGNNFCNYNPETAMLTVREELTSGDHFLFDCHVFRGREAAREQWQEEIGRAYQSELNRRFNAAPLVQHGADPEACEFELELTTVDGPIGDAYRTAKHIRLARETSLRLAGRELDLPEDTTIEMGFTYLYTAEQVRSLLPAFGFEIVRECADPAGDNLLILARPGRN